MNLAERKAYFSQQEVEAKKAALVQPKRHCAFFAGKQEFVFVSSVLFTKQDIDWQITALMAMRSCLPEEVSAQGPSPGSN